MKNTVRKILLWVLLLVMAGGCVVLRIASRNQRADIVCRTLEVSFADSCRFLSEEDVKECLEQHYGAYIGQRLDSVDLCKVEKVLGEKSAVKGAEAFITDDGTLRVDITQREPAILFDRNGYEFYADADGYIFPRTDKVQRSIPVVSGYIPFNCPEGYKGFPAKGRQEKWVSDILGMTAYMKKHYALDKRISEIKVRQDGRLVLAGGKRKEAFIFGGPEGYVEKFEKMNIYEKSIRDSLKNYKTVNLMYKKQIVCK